MSFEPPIIGGVSHEKAKRGFVWGGKFSGGPTGALGVLFVKVFCGHSFRRFLDLAAVIPNRPHCAFAAVRWTDASRGGMVSAMDVSIAKCRRRDAPAQLPFDRAYFGSDWSS